MLSCLLAGTKNPKYVLENIAAFDVRLSKEELAELEQAVPRSAVFTVSGVDPSHSSMQSHPYRSTSVQRNQMLICFV